MVEKIKILKNGQFLGNMDRKTWEQIKGKPGYQNLTCSEEPAEEKKGKK